MGPVVQAKAPLGTTPEKADGKADVCSLGQAGGQQYREPQAGVGPCWRLVLTHHENKTEILWHGKSQRPISHLLELAQQLMREFYSPTEARITAITCL